MSRVSPDCLKWNKRSVNQAFETMGLRNAIMYGAEASAIMDATGSPEADKFDFDTPHRRARSGVEMADRTVCTL